MIFSATLVIAAGLLVFVGLVCQAVDRIDHIPRGWYFTPHEDRTDLDWDDFFGDL